MIGRSRTVVVMLVVAGALTLGASAPSSAGFFDFLFGGFANPGFRPEPPPFAPRPRADRDGSAGARSDRPRISGGGGPATAYCVRLCDGRYFPIQRSSTAQATRLCSAFCPAAQTKVFFGSEIDHAAARDGTAYDKLENAFVYRDKIVDDCTCNGHSPYGLATLDASDDPTLRPGDLIATANGLVKAGARAYGQASDKDLTSGLPSGIRGNGKDAREESAPHHRRHGSRRNTSSRHDVPR